MNTKQISLDAPLTLDPKQDSETVVCANCDSEVESHNATEFGLDNICNGCLPVDCRATAWLQQQFARFDATHAGWRQEYWSRLQGKLMAKHQPKENEIW